jgi:hypothetical protein
MVQNVSTAAQNLPVNARPPQPRLALLQSQTKSTRTDSFSFSAKISFSQSQSIVLDRAFEQLRGVVDEARTALGIPEGQEVDTSADATANRIADFALNFFSQYAENNGLEDNEEGRAQFADFIGGAITQGIDEARGILNALSALDPEIATGIDDTASIIQGRLNDFVTNGLG